MAANRFKTTGAWNTAANWSKGTVPKATEEVEIETGKECELVTTAGKCLSLYVPSGATLKGSIYVEIGSGTTKAEAGGKAGYAIYIPSGATISGYTGEFFCVSTNTEKPKIAIVPEAAANLGIAAAAKAEYVLEAALTDLETLTLPTTEGGLNTNGFAVKSLKVSVSGSKAKLTLGKSEVMVTSTGVAWSVTSTEGTFSMSESTINMSGAGTFAGGGKTYGTVLTPSVVEGSNTFGTLRVKTCELKKATTQTVTTLEGLGTKAIAGEIKSSGTATKEAAKLKSSSAQTVKYMKLQYITAEGATFTDEYSEGETESTYNKEGNTGWTFKVISGGSTIAFSTKVTFKGENKARQVQPATAATKVTLKGEAKLAQLGLISVKGTVKVQGEVKILQRQPVTATGKVSITGIKNVLQVQPLTATTALRLTGSENIHQTQPVTASTKLTISSTNNLRQAQPISANGKTRLAGAVSLSAVQLLFITANGVLTLGGTGTVKQRQPVTASTRVRMTGSATVSEESASSGVVICMII